MRPAVVRNLMSLGVGATQEICAHWLSDGTAASEAGDEEGGFDVEGGEDVEEGRSPLGRAVVEC